MSTWMWVLVGVAAWAALSFPIALSVGRAFALASETEAQGRPVPSQSTRTAPTRRRLVIVDDEPFFRALLAATLAGEELDVVEAGDAIEARDIVRLWRPDVLLLGRMLERERAQRRLLASAYGQTVTALATSLEARDTRTTLHSRRVTRYALALAGSHERELLADPSLVYGFLLHDVGEIGIPDRILLKDGPLEPLEWSVMQRHPVLGGEILGEVELLRGEGLGVVRSHHERWDGAGYPDAVGHDAIPLGARIFAVADTLDAMTSERPYRQAGSWESAVCEVVEQAGRQFDPDVVENFLRAEPELRGIFDQLRSVAA